MSFISAVRNGIRRIKKGARWAFNTFWGICTYPYYLLRRGIFLIVYPSQFLFKPGSEQYDFEREGFIQMLENNNDLFNVDFDLNGNLYREDGQSIAQRQTANPARRFFEATFFTNNLNFAQLYNPNKRYIIRASGNATCYEQLSHEMAAAAQDNSVVIGFNPMGVGTSPGRCNGPEDYQAAIISIIENLHANGVPYDHIVLEGWSLGAAMLTTVAASYHARGIRGPKVIADRTFASLDVEAATLISGLIPYVGSVLYYPIKFLINYFSLNINVARAFNTINEANPGDAIGITAVGDKIIPFAASLYKGVAQNLRDTYIKKYYPVPNQWGAPGEQHMVSHTQLNEANLLWQNPGHANGGAYTFITQARQRFKQAMHLNQAAEHVGPAPVAAFTPLRVKLLQDSLGRDGYGFWRNPFYESEVLPQEQDLDAAVLQLTPT